MQTEPSLANLVYSNVLNHPSFEHALAHRLAERLDHSDVSADLIRQAFHDALAMRPEIGLEARADLAATLERDPALHKAVDCFLYFKGFHAIQTHRFAHALWMGGRRDFALYLQSRSSPVFQVDINPAARIGKGIMLDHATGFVVGETAVIGDNVSILQGVTLGGTGKSEEDRHPKIGNGVLIGAHSVVLGNIKDRRLRAHRRRLGRGQGSAAAGHRCRRSGQDHRRRRCTPIRHRSWTRSRPYRT